MANEKELTHIDLFSGIGGFTLAGEWAGFRTVVFCEKEEFCQKILQKRFGAVADTEGRKAQSTESGRFYPKSCGATGKPLLISEIRDFDGTKWRGATLLTGGFPCQPFSVAGQRRGKEDDRYLWPEMRRVINEAKPHWILAENVFGIFRMALDTVLADLESEGYATGTFIIPACGLNAPHRRNRVWIVANARKSKRNWLPNIGRQKMAEIGNENQNAQNSINDGMRRGSHGNSGGGKRTLQTERSNSHASDPTSERKESISQQRQGSGIESSNSHAPNSCSSGLQIGEMFGQNIQQECPPLIRDAWQEDWYEVATRFCRVDDGVPDRIHRLKALGNAIVPQIAYEILKRIAWIERNE